MIKKTTFWLHNARFVSLPQSLLPALLALCMTIQTNTFSTTLSLCAFASILFLHLAANLVDDYFDYKKNKNIIDLQNNPSKSPIRKGKCNYLISGQTDEKTLLKVILLLFGISLIFGITIFIYRGIIILYYILITGFLCISYSGFPLRLSYHGFGELVIGLIFGPLLMSGVYYTATGSFSTTLWIISCCVGLLVLNILYTHSVMDYEADKSVHKKTLAVILKNKNMMLLISFLITFSPYIILTYCILLNYLSILYSILFIIFPLSIYLFILIFQYIKNPQKKYQTYWWMGIMEQWAAIQQAGIDQFMLRWFLARNICVIFCLITSIICLL